MYLFIDDTPTDVEQVLEDPLSGVIGDSTRDIISSFLSPEEYYVLCQVICQPFNDSKPTAKDRELCFHNTTYVINTLQPKAIFALGSKVSKFLTKKGITHTELPGKFDNYTNELSRQRTRLILNQFFRKES